MNATKTYKSVKGTEIAVGDVRTLGYRNEAAVVAVTLGRLDRGARFADVTLADGTTERCWEDFLYHVGTA